MIKVPNTSIPSTFKTRHTCISVLTKASDTVKLSKPTHIPNLWEEDVVKGGLGSEHIL